VWINPPANREAVIVDENSVTRESGMIAIFDSGASAEVVYRPRATASEVQLSTVPEREDPLAGTHEVRADRVQPGAFSLRTLTGR
jgi:hypothetical protein